MIGKVLEPHGDLGGTLRYVLTKSHAEMLPGGPLEGKSHREIHEAAKVLEQAAATDREKLVFHGILSLHPGESLTKAQWSAAASRYMSELGYERSPWVAVKHNDTEHSHVHIVGLRIDERGRYVEDAFEWRRSREAVDRIERAFDLTPTPPTAPRKAPSSKELAEVERQGNTRDTLPRERIWRALDAALDEKPTTLPELARSLQEHGVRLVPNVARTAEKLSGLRYVHDDSGRSFTAGELGPDAKLPALLSRGVQTGDISLLRSAQAHDRLLAGKDTPELRSASEAWETYLRSAPREEPTPPRVAAQDIAQTTALETIRARFEELARRIDRNIPIDPAQADAAGTTLGNPLATPDVATPRAASLHGPLDVVSTVPRDGLDAVLERPFAPTTGRVPSPNHAYDGLSTSVTEHVANRPQGVQHEPERELLALTEPRRADRPVDDAARAPAALGSPDREPLSLATPDGRPDQTDREHANAAVGVEPSERSLRGAAGEADRGASTDRVDAAEQLRARLASLFRVAVRDRTADVGTAGADLGDASGAQPRRGSDGATDRAAPEARDDAHSGGARARLDADRARDTEYERATSAAGEQRGAAWRAPDPVAEAGALRGGTEGQPADRSRGDGAGAPGSDPRGPAGQDRDLDPSDRRSRASGREHIEDAPGAPFGADSHAEASDRRGGVAVERYELAADRAAVVAAGLTPPSDGPLIETYEALLRRMAFGNERDGVMPATAPSLSTEAAERHAYHRLQLEHQTRGLPRDEDHLDLEIARRMSREGISVEQVAMAIESGSPELIRRHEDTRAYALETAIRANESTHSKTATPTRPIEPDR